MTLVIRPALLTDCSAWAAMRHRLWDDLPLAEHEADIARMLTSAKRTGYLATLSDLPAGFAEISIRDFANGCDSQPVPFLEGIWVEPPYRRQGIGRALVDRICQDLIASGYVELGSDALVDNHPSHQAHGVWGFEETERVVCFRKHLGQAPAQKEHGSSS